MQPQEGMNKERGGWMAAVLIALLIFAVYLVMCSRTTLWDRDEPRFARATVEMVESGNYLYPTFNGVLRPHKPILIYWLMSLPVRVLGPTEVACRFFAAVGTAVTCFLTFIIARQYLGTRAGHWAMVILGSSFMVSYIGTAATADAVLLPFMVAAVAVFAYTVRAAKGFWYTTLMMGVALGGALLAKGPVGLLPVLAIIVTVWLDRRGGVNTRPIAWRLIAATLVGSLIFLVWAIPANTATGGEFQRQGIGYHVLHRILAPMEGHGGQFLLYLPFYLPVIVVGFFPWTLLLPGSISAVLGERVGGRGFRDLFIGWTVPVFIFMTLVATKLPHYILLMWPALALAAAGTITAAQNKQLDTRDGTWLRRGIWLFGPLVAAAAVGFIAGPLLADIPGLLWPCVLCSVVLLCMGGYSIYLQRADRPQASAKVLLVGMLVFQIPFLFGVIPAVEQVKISPDIARAVKEGTPSTMPVATYMFNEPSLNFYMDRLTTLHGDESEVVEWAKEPEPGVLIIPKSHLDLIEKRYGSLRLSQIASKKGFDYSKGRDLEVLALLRKPDAPG